MKKMLFLSIILVSLSLVGCTKQETDDYEHYNLNGKDYRIYNFYDDEKGNQTYLLFDMTPENSEIVTTGLFYKISSDDYILLQKLENTKRNAYNDESIYYFYNKILYGVGNGNTPMSFEIELNGRKSKLEKLEFNVNGYEQINPFLTNQILSIDDNKIDYYGNFIIDGHTKRGIVECSLLSNQCEFMKYND